MNAVVFDSFGPPAEVLAVRSRPRPPLARGRVRVRMRIVPINPSDLMVIRGRYSRLPVLPATPGFEGYGVIEETGPGLIARLRGLKPGRRVAVLNSDGGNWAEEVVISARHVVPVPDSIPDEQVATFFVNPATVLAMVDHVLAVKPGSWLVQSAAGSALGRMVIQLGKTRGFRTINLVRRETAVAELKAFGGDAVFATETDGVIERIAELTHGAMAPFALDCVGGATGLIAVKALATKGRMLVYGTLSGESIPLDPRLLIGGQKSIGGFWLSDWANAQGPLTMLRLFGQIKRLLERGVLTSPIESIYALDQVREAMVHAERAGRRGKILLRL